MKDEEDGGAGAFFPSSFILPPSSFANAHSNTFRQLLLVQTAPPCSPTNDLIAAELFMYVMGTMVWPGQASWSCAQQSRVWSRLAMSAIEQPAPRSGRITRTDSSVRMSALSAMKWTPQKMTY